MEREKQGSDCVVLNGHVKNFGLYAKSSGKSLKSPGKRRSEVIRRDLRLERSRGAMQEGLVGN